MATYSPLNLEEVILSALSGTPASSGNGFGLGQLGGASTNGFSSLGLGSSATSNPVTSTLNNSTGNGSWFSSLFADDGLFSRNSMFGGTDQKTGLTQGGWAPTALGIGQAILGGLQGSKTLKLAEDQFKESKRQFDLNFNAQRQTINTDLEDRQRARVASNAGAYEGVESYLNRNKV